MSNMVLRDASASKKRKTLSVMEVYMKLIYFVSLRISEVFNHFSAILKIEVFLKSFLIRQHWLLLI